MKTIRIVASATLALACLFVAPAAHADVDVQIRNGDQVSGTLNPVDEQEVFRFSAPGGSTLTVVAKGKKSGKGKNKRPPPTVTFRLLDDLDEEIAAPGGLVVAKGKGAQLKKFILDEGDVREFRVVVSAVGDEGGDYTLKVVWKNKTKHTAKANTHFNNDDPDTSSPPVITFQADAGSKIKAAAVGRGQNVARLIGVYGVDNDESFDFEEPASEKVKSHRGKLVLEHTGTFELETDDFTFGNGGPMTVSLSIKPVKSKRKVDLTAGKIGGFGDDGGDVVRGQVVGILGTNDGDLLPFGELFDETSPLFGTDLDIPEGALSSPTAILVGTAPDIPPGSGQQGAGPTVFFGPDGTKFNTDVTVTIPFNENAFDSNQSGLSVLTSENGNVSEVDDVTVNTGEGTVSFPTDHFSSFRVVGNQLPLAPPGDVTGDTVADLLIPAAVATATPEETVYVFPGGTGLGALGTAATPANAAFSVFFDGGGSSEFGQSVQTGDFNADGVEDIAVADSLAGDVFVFFGGAALGAGGDVGSSAAQVNLNSGIDQMGIDMAVADVDDDRIADVVAGAPDGSGDDSIGLPGVAYAFGGRVDFGTLPALLETGDPGVVILAGENDLDTFGQSVAVGDVNGDGKNDIIVGATRDSDLRNNPDSGTVYIFRGGANLTDTDVNLKPPTIIRGVHGDATVDGDAFGKATQVGDLNGDGIGDLIVGSPKNNENGARCGAVFVFFGGTDIRKAKRAADANRKYLGIDADDYFGDYVGAGDVNGDGIDDLIVGAPGRDVAATANGGAVYVIFGSANLAASGTVTAVVNVTLTGEKGGDHLGAIGPSRDYTGDGIDDLVVFAPFWQTGIDFAQGRCYVFPGSSSFGSLGSAGVATAPVIITGRDSQQLGDPYRSEIFPPLSKR